MKITLHQARADEVLDRLIHAFQAKEFPYNLKAARPPHVPENLPRNLTLGSRSHALYLFCLCYYMRGGLESNVAARLLSRVYEKRPDIFVPEFAGKFNQQTIFAALKTVRLGRENQVSSFWIPNFQKLAEEWNGHPAKILEGVTNFDAACERIQRKNGNGFAGFQKKMVSMLIYFLTDTGFITPFPFPAPVDFHVLRVAIANEFITIEPEDGENAEKGFTVSDVMTDAVRGMLLDYCLRRKADPLILSEVMWLLSRMICVRNPGNMSMIETHRRVRGRSRKVDTKPFRLTRGNLEWYEGACGSCPIEPTCRFNIPSAPYYVHGNIEIRGERTKSPSQISIFSTHR